MAGAGRTSGGRTGPLRLLRANRPLRLLWTARSVSFLGDSLGLVALMLYVASTTGEALAVALLLLVGDFAPALLGPLTGTVADRFPLARVMVACELAQGALVAVTALWLPSLPLLMTLVALRAVAGQVFAPASRAAVPALVADADLEAANTAVGFGTHGGEVLGPLLAALLLPVLGTRGVLLVDAAGFAVSAALLAILPLPARPAPDGGVPTGFGADTVAGLRYLVTTPLVRAVGLGFFAVVAFNGIDDVALVFLATDTFGGGDREAGALLAAVGVGLFAGYALLGRSPRTGTVALLLAGFAVSSAGNLLTGLAWGVGAAFAVQAVRGLGLAGMDVALTTLLQRTVPRELLGRVFGSLHGAIGAGAALAYVLGGLLIDATGPRVALVVAGSGGLLATGAVAVALRGRSGAAPAGSGALPRVTGPGDVTSARVDAPHQTYPPAERLDLVENLHGHEVADPYRWLEDPADPRTVEWSAAQDKLAREHLDALAGRDALTARLHELLSAGSVSAPLWRSGRAFFTRREPGQEHAVLHVRETDGAERVLIDPMDLDATGLTTLDAWVPDLEGRRLAYQLSSGGDEHSVLHVLDVTSGAEVEPPIDRCRYSSVAWLPGGEEFFLVRMVAEHEAPVGEQAFHRRVWRHRVGESTGSDELVEGPGLYDGHTYFGVRVSRDGRWLVVTGNVGTARRDSVWIAAVGASTPALTPVLTQADDVQCGAWVDCDGLLYLHTTDGAPRWRLAVTDPRTPGREHWRELVAQDPGSVLQAVRRLEPAHGEFGPLLVLARARHAVAEVVLVSVADGAARGTVPLPGTGSLTGFSVGDRDTPEQAGRLWLGWTDLVTPPQVHRFDVASGRTVLETAAPGAVSVPAGHTEQREFTSADGTTVRMFVITPDGPRRERPALVTGYGGFGISREPSYTTAALAWVAAGGTYALVSLRGGGEEGEDWHLAGNRGEKRRVFEDLHAAAAALIDAGDTTADRLAIMGGSNGGLLVGAALTQRPALYRAVVCSAPLLDMVRYERFSLGRTWNDEYGTADDPEQLGWLLSYSPYHRVRPGIEYPAVLFTVFESDSRVDPLHARKTCAALQHATTGDPDTRPVLIRRETDVGHSARSVSRAVALTVDQLAFLAAHTGLELR